MPDTAAATWLTKPKSKKAAPGPVGELWRIIVQSEPEIRIENDVSDDGDMAFTVSIFSLGLNFGKMGLLKTSTRTGNTLSAIGEYLITTNLPVFWDWIFRNKEKYRRGVGKYQHKKFGMKLVNHDLTFKFHISLLQDIFSRELQSAL